MIRKQIKKTYYEENHCHFYIKYFTIIDDNLERVMQYSGLLKKNEKFFIEFTPFYVYFEEKQSRHFKDRCFNYEDINKIYFLMKDHLKKLEKLKSFSNNIEDNLFKKRKILEVYEKYWNLHKSIPSYDFVIHMILNTMSEKFRKENNLSYYDYFNLTLPEKTIITEKNLELLNKIIQGYNKELLKKEYSWCPNLSYILKMNKRELKNKILHLNKVHVKNKKQVHKILKTIKDREKLQKIKLFMESHKWVNRVDYTERIIDHFSRQLNLKIINLLGLDLHDLKIIEEIKNLTPIEIKKIINESIKKNKLLSVLEKRRKNYTLAYNNKLISVNGGTL